MNHPLLRQLGLRHARLRRRLLLGWIVAATAVGATLLMMVGATGSATGLAVAGAIAALAAWLRFRPWPQTALARWLDGHYPELEDSTALLLDTPAGQLAQAQHARITARLRQLMAGQPLERALPRPPIGLVVLAIALITALGMLRPLLEPPPAAPQILVELIPPAYTGLSGRRVPLDDLQAPAGSTIIWSAPDAERMSLQVIGGRQIEQVGERLETVIDESLVYRLTVTRQNHQLQTAAMQLEVIPDRPPVVSLEQPTRWPVLFQGLPSTGIGIQLVASDDYGIAETELLLTVASGEGESVRFRDRALPLPATGTDNRGRRIYRQQLQLEPLELAPGDELYLRAVFLDNRSPEPNRTVAPTVIYRWVAPAEERQEVAGMPVDRMPEYFRSQRQIIIDTERLIEESDDLDAATLRARSEGIALDQRTLRLRYGEHLGEEVSTEPGGSEPDDHAHAGHDEAPAAATDVLETFGHSHDSAEHATLFDDETRATLKGALQAMWQAELQLGLVDPARALPFEYSALDQLKAVQQAARIYVKRVGFEPPPLSEERRLTGELEDARSLTADPPRDAHAAAPVREVLEALVSGAEPASMRQKLQLLAADRSLPLPLRSLAARSEAGDCEDCRAELIGALWAQVGPAHPRPNPARYPGGERLRTLWQQTREASR